jgi:hypothetical protein
LDKVAVFGGGVRKAQPCPDKEKAQIAMKYDEYAIQIGIYIANWQVYGV